MFSAAAAAASFEGLMASFQIVKNLLSYFGLYEFLEKRIPNR